MIRWCRARNADHLGRFVLARDDSKQGREQFVILCLVSFSLGTIVWNPNF